MKPQLTLEELRAVPEGELTNELWEFYLKYETWHRGEQRVDERSNPSAEDQDEIEGKLSLGVRLARSLVRFDFNVLNGGILQYMGNHRPDEIEEDLAAFQRIGANDTAVVIERAISVYRRHGWPDFTRSFRSWAPFDDPDLKPLEQLDELRCNNASSCRDYELMERYLREHLDECVMLD